MMTRTEQIATKEQEIADLKKVHAEIKQRKVYFRTLEELIACGVDISGGPVNGRDDTSIMLSDLVGKMSSGDRIRCMVKHGRKAMKIVEEAIGEARPTYEQFCEIMNSSAEYSRDVIESALNRKAFDTTTEAGAELTNKYLDMTKDIVKDDTAVEISMSALYRAARFADRGANQFMLSSKLSAALMLTDVPKLNANEIKLPYDGFLISLPSGSVPFFLRSGEAEWADAILLDATPNDPQILWIVKCRGVEIRWTSNGFAPEDVQAPEENEQAYAAEDEIVMSAARRLVTNFLLWLNAEGGMQKRHRIVVPPKLAEKRKASGEEWPRQWEFGKEVTLSRELQRMAAEIALGRSRKHAVDGWKLRARFTVRGHWRNQAHGPGLTLRQRKWIAPFWKGPSEAEAWAHIYKADAP